MWKSFAVLLFSAQILQIHASPIVDHSVLREDNSLMELRDTDDAAGITYHGPITPGGENISLFGSAQEIYEQILVLNPSFDPMEFAVIRDAEIEMAAVLAQHANEEAMYAQYNEIFANTTETDGLASRQVKPDDFRWPSERHKFIDYKAKCCYCSPNPYDQWAKSDHLADKREGPSYWLRALPGTCAVDANKWARVSCSWNAGIWVLNNNPFESHPLCNTLGTMAVAINDNCRAMRRLLGAQKLREYTNGQIPLLDQNLLVIVGSPYGGC